MIQEKLKELELQLNYVCYDKELITRLSKVWDAYYDLKGEVKKLNIPAVIHWVAITEKMPESGFCILLYSKNGGVAEGSWIGEKGHFEQWRWNTVIKDVTYWAELPQPPCT